MRTLITKDCESHRTSPNYETLGSNLIIYQLNPIYYHTSLELKGHIEATYGFNPIHKNITKRIMAITSVAIAILKIV
jgi:hypothetical protein